MSEGIRRMDRNFKIAHCELLDLPIYPHRWLTNDNIYISPTNNLYYRIPGHTVHGEISLLHSEGFYINVIPVKFAHNFRNA